MLFFLLFFLLFIRGISLFSIPNVDLDAATAAEEDLETLETGELHKCSLLSYISICLRTCLSVQLIAA